MPLPTLLLAAVLQTLSPGAASPAPPSTTAATPVPAPTAKDPLVCRRTANTGSRLGGGKECMTKAQWAEREQGNAQNLRDMQTRSFQTRPQ